jgi:hypothetical protein
MLVGCSDAASIWMQTTWSFTSSIPCAVASGPAVHTYIDRLPIAEALAPGVLEFADRQIKAPLALTP